jgi:HD-GYP domain-containing protein (c-di-GMP phosphodiesterase class II)
MAKAQSLEAIAEDAVATAARLLDAEEAEIWLRRGDAFECAGRLGPGRGRRMDDERATRLLEGRQTPFVIPGRRGSTPPRAVAPLHYGDSLEGWIRVTAPGMSGFGDERLRLLGGIADQAAVALQKARLYADEKESAEIANALLDFGRQLASAEGLECVLARTVELAARTVGSPRTTVWLQDSEDADLVVRAWHGYGPNGVEWIKQLRIGSGRTQDALTIDDPFLLDGGKVSKDAAGTTFAVAPIRLDGGRLGCIVAELPVPEEIGEQRMRLLAGIAHQAKLAIANAGSFESLETTFLSTVEALANALEANDEYTSSHARWITDMALRVGEELGLDGASLKRLELGALFHDIGKIGVPASILSKPGPLTSDERAIIELHPELGERILAPIDRLSDVRAIVRSCHERWDGAGYPDRRAGEEIPIEARIILVCDAYHAMTTDRPYRKRLSVAEARRRLERAAGTQFDPQVVETFLRVPVDGLESHTRVSALLVP